MARNDRGRNNNPEGYNQHKKSWTDTARESPATTAAVAAAAVGAGVFLWSRRNQISDQLTGLSEQISDWSSNLRSGSSEGEFEMAEEGGMGASMNRGTKSRSANRGMSETGGGNASLGAHSGGSGTTGTASGRGRAGQAPTG